LISDKIEAGDSKRKVVQICFGCPMKRNCLGWSSAMAGVEARTGKLTREGRDGEEGEEEQGAAVGHHGGELHQEGSTALSCSFPSNAPVRAPLLSS
jgi:hypothetical protein